MNTQDIKELKILIDVYANNCQIFGLMEPGCKAAEATAVYIKELKGKIDTILDKNDQSMIGP